jgi:hypothetical protein
MAEKAETASIQREYFRMINLHSYFANASYQRSIFPKNACHFNPKESTITGTSGVGVT